MRTREVFSLRTACAFVASLALGACSPPGPGADAGDAAGGDAEGPIDVGTVRYEQVQAIYNTSCATFSSCHNSEGVRGDLDLTAASSFIETVREPSTQARGMAIVEPSNVERSYLWHKLQGSMRMLTECADSPARCGTRMPMVGGAPLSAMELAVIRAWIEQGARGPDGTVMPPRTDAGGSDATTTDATTADAGPTDAASGDR